jgi:hypothetical protein
MADTLLPSAFAELEPYAEAWCLPTESERWDKRMASTMIEMREFHEAFFPRLEEAIEYCDKFPLDDIPEDAAPAASHLLADPGCDGGRSHASTPAHRRRRRGDGSHQRADPVSKDEQ